MVVNALCISTLIKRTGELQMYIHASLFVITLYTLTCVSHACTRHEILFQIDFVKHLDNKGVIHVHEIVRDLQFIYHQV